jgi:hypothetical protein
LAADVVNLPCIILTWCHIVTSVCNLLSCAYCTVLYCSMPSICNLLSCVYCTVFYWGVPGVCSTLNCANCTVFYCSMPSVCKFAKLCLLHRILLQYA